MVIVLGYVGLVSKSFNLFVTITYIAIADFLWVLISVGLFTNVFINGLDICRLIYQCFH